MTPASWDGSRPPGAGPGQGAGPGWGSGPGRGSGQGAGRGGGLLRPILWGSVPILSIGFLSFVPFLAFAVIQRRKRDWVVFAVYLAATVAMIIALGAFTSGGATAGVGGFIIALAGCAAVHAAVLFRPSRSLSPRAAAVPLSPRQRNQQAVAQAQDRIERRKSARHLAKTNPSLARDLRIGRPDLPRDYDDGGLVDVNHVPGPVLAVQLGLSPTEVSDVLAARGRLGRFGSTDELCAYTSLSPDRVDQLSELMIFG